MSHPHRRALLKTGGASAMVALLPGGQGQAALPVSTIRPRIVEPLDTDWRFHLGHASDPAKDFGFGRSHDTYAKSGDAGTPAAEAKFDAKDWAVVSLPHDWAVDLPFERFGAPGSDEDKTGAY